MDLAITHAAQQWTRVAFFAFFGVLVAELSPTLRRNGVATRGGVGTRGLRSD